MKITQPVEVALVQELEGAAAGGGTQWLDLPFLLLPP